MKAVANLPKKSAHQQSTSMRNKVKPYKLLDLPLFRDIDMLSDILSHIVDRDNPIAHNLYERLWKHSQNRATNSSDPEPHTMMIQSAKEFIGSYAHFHTGTQFDQCC